MKGIPDFVLKLIQKFGVYKLGIDAVTSYVENFIDKYPGVRAASDKFYDDGSIEDIIKSYVIETETVNDDNVPEKIQEYKIKINLYVDMVIDILNEFKTIVSSSENKSLKQLLYNIKIKGIKVKDINIPDFTPDDSTDNVRVGEIVDAIMK